MTARCHVCIEGEVVEAPAYRDLRRVTSDCQPWPAGGAIGACSTCGAVQKVVDDAWRGEIRRIYDAYAIYHQGSGAEQAVFDPTGAAESRSGRLVARLSAALELPRGGRLLDIGCGNGAFLRAFAACHPAWRLTGTEIGARNRAAVEAIGQVERFHAGDFADLDGTFDMVSLIHVLEHVENPVAFLKRVAACLAPRGAVLIEVPFFHDNPFDLLIADHATHFTPAVLSCVLQAAGFTVDTLAIDWVAKEISAVVHAGGCAVPLCGGSGGEYERLAGGVAWLKSVADDARAAAASGRFGIFGTSIAGVWLYGEVDGRVDFFLDEDANRIGATLFDRPILSPEQRPSATTFVPLAPAVAAAVARRLGGGADLLVPSAPASS